MPVIMLSGSLPGPDSLSGLTGWWSADYGVYSDAGTTPAVDGDGIYQWNDRSGNGRHFYMTSASNRPMYKTSIVSGNPVARFGGATDDDHMETTGNNSSVFFAAGAKTIFCVMYHRANAEGSPVGNQERDHVGLLFSNTGQTIRAYNYDGSSDVADKTGLSTATWYIGTMLHSAGAIYAGANDTRTASMATAASGDTGMLDLPMTLGKRANASPFPLDGDIAETVFFNVALSEANRQVVERYLAAKYAITIPY